MWACLGLRSSSPASAGPRAASSAAARQKAEGTKKEDALRPSSFRHFFLSALLQKARKDGTTSYNTLEGVSVTRSSGFFNPLIAR